MEMLEQGSLGSPQGGNPPEARGSSTPGERRQPGKSPVRPLLPAGRLQRAASLQPVPWGPGGEGAPHLGTGGTDPGILGRGHNAQNLGRQCGDIPALKGHMGPLEKTKPKHNFLLNSVYYYFFFTIES